MSDPIGFIAEDNFDGVEFSEGFAGRELVDPQWAKVTLVEAEFGKSPTSGTARVRCRVQLDEVFSLTPRRSMFADLYLTDKMQAQVDGWCVALGLGLPGQRVGEATSPKDNRPQGSKEQIGMLLAAGFKGRSMVACIDIESHKEYGDRNRLQGWHRASEENLAAIRMAGFDAKGIVVKSRKDEATGRRRNYLAVKGMGAARGGSKPAPAATQAVID